MDSLEEKLRSIGNTLREHRREIVIVTAGSIGCFIIGYAIASPAIYASSYSQDVDPNCVCNPSAEFDPDELSLCSDNTEIVVTGGKLCDTSDDTPGCYATDVDILYEVLKGAEYVEDVVIEPNSIEELIGCVSYILRVHTNQVIPAGEQVQIRLYPGGGLEGHPTHATVTLTSGCGSTAIELVDFQAHSVTIVPKSKEYDIPVLSAIVASLALGYSALRWRTKNEEGVYL